METLQKIALLFTIVGALNWGFIGFFDINLVETLFGDLSFLIYILVGIAGIWSIAFYTRVTDKKLTD